MTELDSRIRRLAVPRGLILGLVTLVLSIVSFYITISGSTPFKVTVLPLFISGIVPLALAILLCYNLRIAVGNYWSIRQATTGIFIMFILAYVMQFVGRDVIFARFIEPQMIDKTEAAVLRATDSFLKTKTNDQTIIDQKDEQISKQFEAAKKVTVLNMLEGVAVSVILVFVVSLIFAALFKKDPPLFNPELQPVKEE